ncbi:YbiU family protein [uncultured Friedmanniella sp.]|uniref:YbiU family protein n=1 Tax=uncultured Friedmanniella sp. TaxID=335381 RepID=UPI0035C9794C
MTSTSTSTHRSELSGLPHWESLPEDLPAAIVEVKAAIRDRIAASGRTVEEVVAEVEEFLRAEVADIRATRERGEEVWPVIDYTDVEAGTVSEETLALVQRRGCAVIRRHFTREQAERWDAAIVDYVDGNHFFENYAGPADDFFGDLEASKPEIYPVYWSSAQMEARQHPRMAAVQSFLNARWTSDGEGRSWFDPDRDSLYPDRIRRRPPGVDSGGLGTHSDPGTLDLWMTEGYQQTFRHLFAGDFAAYDPWDAAYRTEAAQYPGSTMCSAFRTFQGWTALSEMANDQGVLHTVPIPKAMAYLMLRPLLSDVAEDDMCGVKPNHTFPTTRRWHDLLTDAVSSIPSVQPGDSVWWHCDMVHSVAPVQQQQGWGNVMYIPAAPWCRKNEDYAGLVSEAFTSGRSPSDFPEEDYEVSWPDRFRPDQLNEIGRRGLGL